MGARLRSAGALALACFVGCGLGAPEPPHGAPPHGGTQRAGATAAAYPPESFFDVHGDTLSTPRHGHIRLPPGHAGAESRTRVVLSPSAARVLVETLRGACGPQASHVVDLVVLEPRTVERVAEGRGWVKARFDGEQAVVAPRACAP